MLRRVLKFKTVFYSKISKVSNKKIIKTAISKSNDKETESVSNLTIIE